jgi:hypothetical protein
MKGNFNRAREREREGWPIGDEATGSFSGANRPE